MSTTTDVQLHGDVMGELEFGPRLDTSRVAVAVRHGVVTLSGSVPTDAARWAAESAVKRVCGVLGVTDELTVQPSPEVRPTDRDIAEAARWALEWSVTPPEKNIQIKVESGWLTLEGEVGRQNQCQSAQDAVAHLRGVQGVINLLGLRTQISSPQVTPGDIHARTEPAFQRGAELGASQVLI